MHGNILTSGMQLLYALWLLSWPCAQLECGIRPSIGYVNTCAENMMNVQHLCTGEELAQCMSYKTH